MFSSGPVASGGIFWCWSKCREGHGDDEGSGTQVLGRAAEGAGVIYPGENDTHGYCSLQRP